MYYSTINSFGGLHLTKLLIIILIYSDYQNNASFNLLTLMFSLIYCSLANGNIVLAQYKQEENKQCQI